VHHHVSAFVFHNAAIAIGLSKAWLEFDGCIEIGECIIYVALAFLIMPRSLSASTNRMSSMAFGEIGQCAFQVIFVKFHQTAIVVGAGIVGSELNRFRVLAKAPSKSPLSNERVPMLL